MWFTSPLSVPAPVNPTGETIGQTAREGLPKKCGQSTHAPPNGRVTARESTQTPQHPALDSRRTRVGVAAARIRGQIRGRPPKLNHRPERHSVGLDWTGRSTVREIGELFTVSGSTRLPRRPASRPHR